MEESKEDQDLVQQSLKLLSRLLKRHDLANDDSYVALKRVADDKQRWRHRKKDVINLLYSTGLLKFTVLLFNQFSFP